MGSGVDRHVALQPRFDVPGARNDSMPMKIRDLIKLGDRPRSPLRLFHKAHASCPRP